MLKWARKRRWEERTQMCKLILESFTRTRVYMSWLPHHFERQKIFLVLRHSYSQEMYSFWSNINASWISPCNSLLWNAVFFILEDCLSSISPESSILTSLSIVTLLLWNLFLILYQANNSRKYMIIFPSSYNSSPLTNFHVVWKIFLCFVFFHITSYTCILQFPTKVPLSCW